MHFEGAAYTDYRDSGHSNIAQGAWGYHNACAPIWVQLRHGAKGQQLRERTGSWVEVSFEKACWVELSRILIIIYGIAKIPILEYILLYSWKEIFAKKIV